MARRYGEAGLESPGEAIMARMMWGLFLLAAVSANARAGAKDYFTEFEKNFGTTPRGPVLVHYFIVTNTTDKPITLGQARVSCGCTSAKVLVNALKPGESTAVFAAMDTARIPQAGLTKSVTIFVPFFGAVNEEIQLRVQTVVRDDLVLSPHALAFGDVVKGKKATATVKFTLYNHPNWEVTAPTSTGAYLKPEVKLLNRGTSEVSYEVSAALDPTCPAGNWTAEVWVKTNAPGIESLRVPVTVNVTTPISITPEKMTLANLAVGKETEHRIELKGNTAFKVLQVKGVNDIIGVKAGSEAASPLHLLTITVKPKVAGDLSTTLEIETDNKEMPLLSLPIKASVSKEIKK